MNKLILVAVGLLVLAGSFYYAAPKMAQTLGIVKGLRIENGREIFTLTGGQIGEVRCGGSQMTTRWLDPVGSPRRNLQVTCVAGTTPTPTTTPAPTATPAPTSTPTPPSTPTPTVTPATGGTSVTFPDTNPLTLGTCSKEIHDKYFVVGPDGNKYRTWHPVKDTSGCTFAHEHGDRPHPSGPKPAFGYAAHIASMDAEIAGHPGFKVFTHYSNGNSGFGSRETDYRGEEMNFTLTVHQGTSGARRIIEDMHSVEFWSDRGGTTHIFGMANTGKPCGKSSATATSCGRIIVDHAEPAYENWDFSLNIGNVWNTGDMTVATTNPMNHLHDVVRNSDGTVASATLKATSEEICFLSPGSNCNFPFGSPEDNSYWLGNSRTVHEPDFAWTNSGGQTEFCTNATGGKVTCGNSTIKQRVASINLDNSRASLLLRTTNEPGFNSVHLPLGAPGGN